MRFPSFRRSVTDATISDPTPGPQYDNLPDAPIEVELRGRLTKLITKRTNATKRGKTSVGLGLFMIGVAIYFGTTYDDKYEVLPYVLMTILYGAALCFMGAIILSTQALDIEIHSIEDDLDLLAVQRQSPTVRAYTLFRRHQLDLKRYYNQSLTHSKVIFFVGIACIASGFTIVGFTLYLLNKNLHASTTSQIIIGTVGAIGGLLSNFIAALYLRMFTTTSESLSTQHDRLISTHFLHFGNFLATKVESDAGLREETFSSMAKSLADFANHKEILDRAAKREPEVESKNDRSEKK
ncbi:hypothetical protein J7E97_18070 [Streptomyces sp. ISL-66]|uniref:TRADD-N-associated membrane domain-containing protein n=1 Tax=Streptomyces sp. ISL-66 TaxID=2819186 RepID=UPI001BE5B98A|nr:hypothetical protein [Streptomyces sp. ISL-66]MBT2469730.1 hypothetical protein [Streptomyces sp. ISL-66]